MENKKEAINALHDIKNIMEKSTKFNSLSGLSLITAGIVALISAFAAAYTLNSTVFQANLSLTISGDQLLKLVVNGIITLKLAIVCAFIFTKIKSDKLNISLFSKSSLQLCLHLAIPLIIGGIVCAAFIQYGRFVYVAPLTLLFYGLGLVSASKYTHSELFYLGLVQLCLGCVGLYFLGNGLIIWTLGFGAAHILWGIHFYKKHD